MPLDGKRVLITEDEFAIALDLARELEQAGAEVVGPARTVNDALAIIDEADLDGAIVDVLLRSGSFFQVADALEDRGIPFVFCTGFITAGQVPPRHAGVPLLEKRLRPAPSAARSQAS